MVNVSHIVLIFALAILVLFFVLGVVLSPTAQRTLEEQEKFVQIFSKGIIKTSEGSSVKLTCTPKQQFYEYEADMKITLEPNPEIDNLMLAIIAFLDERTFDSGKREGEETISVIEYPYETEAELKFALPSKELREEGALHVTFWKFSRCIEKNVEKKESLLDLVNACPDEYLYAGFFWVPNEAVDNSACICDETTQSECESKDLCYWDNKCKNCKFFDNCGELNEDQCKGCRFARDNCIWASACVAKPSTIGKFISVGETEEISNNFCEVRFIVKNNEAFDWTQNDKVKVIMDCEGNELIPVKYVPPFSYIELASGESIEYVNRDCKTSQDKEWKINLYINCDDFESSCGPNKRLLESIAFRC